MTIEHFSYMRNTKPPCNLLSQRLNKLQFYSIIMHHNILFISYKFMFININVLIMKISNTLFWFYYKNSNILFNTITY